jgi:hypothetical protein
MIFSPNRQSVAHCLLRQPHMVSVHKEATPPGLRRLCLCHPSSRAQRLSGFSLSFKQRLEWFCRADARVRFACEGFFEELLPCLQVGADIVEAEPSILMVRAVWGTVDAAWKVRLAESVAEE